MSRSNQALRGGKSTLREGKDKQGPEAVSGAFAFLSFFKGFFFFFKCGPFFKKYYLFIYVWLLWLIAAPAFLSRERAESMVWLLLLWNTASGGFSSCGSQL